MNDNTARTEEKVEKSGSWFLFSVAGRISRKPFWVFMVIVTLGAVVLSYFEGATINIKKVNDAQIIYLIVMSLPSVAVLAKRWHDRNRSALWVLIFFVPVVGPVWTLVEAGFLPGTPGPNEFGPDPLRIEGKKGRSDEVRK